MSEPSNKYRDILKQYWGYDSFRSLQEEVIISTGEDRDTLCLMPTGGGKSITFQVPALARKGLCLVITPLIALMKDQAENLKRQGIRAAAIYTGMSYHEMQIALDNCAYGDYKFLYVSPERLQSARFLEQIPRLNISLLAVDEAHCISQWGYDFRPAYLKIADIRKMLPGVNVLALTATATPDVVKDIQQQLQFATPNVFQKSFARKNLAYVVRKSEDKNEQLLKILKALPGSSVVYVRNRKKTKEIAEFLSQKGMSADYYHAGLSNAVKDSKQSAWKTDRCRVMVATNAFGMGIDKANVRSVVHLDLPDNLEAYFQEAGRAGRDEQQAYAVLLYNNNDVAQLKKRLTDQFPEKDFIRRVYDAVGDYLGLGVENGEGMSFNFDLMDFCAKFHFASTPAYYAIKIIELCGYWELVEEPESYSRIMFTTQRDHLYNTQLSPRCETVVNTLLRSYTGLFADYIIIYEEQLAQRLNMQRKELYETLSTLNHEGIIHYIPYRSMPYIHYLRQRERGIYIGREVYEVRRERFQNRIESMLSYAQNDQVCRSRQLLAYFGETDSKDCGYCDVCLAQKRNDKLPIRIQESLLQLLQNGPTSLNELKTKLPCSPETLTGVIRHLMDLKKVQLDPSGTVSLAH